MVTELALTAPVVLEFVVLRTVIARVVSVNVTTSFPKPVIPDDA